MQNDKPLDTAALLVLAGEAKRLSDEVTGGEWEYRTREPGDEKIGPCIHIKGGFCVAVLMMNTPLDDDWPEQASNNGPFIAWARNNTATLAAGIEQLVGEVDRLRALVRHCWVHSGYLDCGSNQMTTEQQELYRSIVDDRPTTNS